MITLKIVEKPTVEPITLSEVKSHLRLENPEEDLYLESLIVVARHWLEGFLNQSLIDQVWHLHWCWEQSDTIGLLSRDAFLNRIWLPKGPVVTIKSVTSGKEGHQRCLSNYDVKRQGAQLCLDFKEFHQEGDIIYSTGYGSSPAEIPADLRYCLIRIVGSSYENRHFINPEDLADVRLILHPYRHYRLG